MFRRFGEAIRKFMYGRYGSDQLNIVLLVAAIAVSLTNSLLSFIFRDFFVYMRIINPLLYFLMLALLGFGIFRMLSRNIYARQKENRKFRQLWTCLKDRKNRYFHCPKCKQMVRVPRGRGKINITCPKCGERFIKKS